MLMHEGAFYRQFLHHITCHAHVRASRLSATLTTRTQRNLRTHLETKLQTEHKYSLDLWEALSRFLMRQSTQSEGHVLW